ncbi:putative RNA ligase-like protein [Namao virus]|nr:putative RNA ligase-like protein [Namao virus]
MASKNKKSRVFKTGNTVSILEIDHCLTSDCDFLRYANNSVKNYITLYSDSVLYSSHLLHGNRSIFMYRLGNNLYEVIQEYALDAVSFSAKDFICLLRMRNSVINPVKIMRALYNASVFDPEDNDMLEKSGLVNEPFYDIVSNLKKLQLFSLECNIEFMLYSSMIKVFPSLVNINFNEHIKLTDLYISPKKSKKPHPDCLFDDIDYLGNEQDNDDSKSEGTVSNYNHQAYSQIDDSYMDIEEDNVYLNVKNHVFNLTDCHYGTEPYVVNTAKKMLSAMTFIKKNQQKLICMMPSYEGIVILAFYHKKWIFCTDTIYDIFSSSSGKSIGSLFKKCYFYSIKKLESYLSLDKKYYFLIYHPDTRKFTSHDDKSGIVNLMVYNICEKKFEPPEPIDGIKCNNYWMVNIDNIADILKQTNTEHQRIDGYILFDDKKIFKIYKDSIYFSHRLTECVKKSSYSSKINFKNLFFSSYNYKPSFITDEEFHLEKYMVSVVNTVIYYFVDKDFSKDYLIFGSLNKRDYDDIIQKVPILSNILEKFVRTFIVSFPSLKEIYYIFKTYMEEKDYINFIQCTDIIYEYLEHKVKNSEVPLPDKIPFLYK